MSNQTPARHSRRAGALAAALVLAMAGCAHQGAVPDASPEPWPVDPVTASMSAMMGSQPMQLYVRADRLDGLNRALGEALGDTLGADRPSTRPPGPPGSTLDQLARVLGLGEDPWPSLDALDPRRPVMLGYGLRSDPEAVATVGQGDMLDTSEVPPFTHLRMLLPTVDPERTRGSLQGWLLRRRNLRLQPLGQSWHAVQGAPMIMGDNELLVAVVTDGDVVRVDALTGPLVGGQQEVLANLATSPPAARADTPALLHFREGEGAIGLYLDMAGVRQMVLTSRLEEAHRWPTFQRRHSAPPEYALGMASWLAAVRVLDLDEQGTLDAAVSLKVGDGLEARLTRTLTAQGRKAADAARSNAAPVYRPQSPAPMFSASMRFSPRASTQARATPRWAQTEFPTRTLNRAGNFARIWALLDHPWRLLDGAMRDELGQPAEGALPDSLSLVLEGAAPALDGGFPNLVGGLVAHYRQAPPTAMIQAIEAALSGPDAPEGWTLKVEPQGQGARLTLAAGRPIEELFEMDAPVTIGPELTLGAHLGPLGIVAKLTGNPELATLASLLRDATLTSRAEGACEATVVRLIPGEYSGDERPAPVPMVVPTPEGMPEVAPSPGAPCLSRTLERVQQALDRHARTPQTLAKSAMDAIHQSPQDVACLKADPATAPALARLESSTWMIQARAALFEGFEHEAITLAKAACDLGRAGGCALVEALQPPVEEGALRLPQATWGEGVTGTPQARLHLSRDNALWLDKHPLGDLTLPLSQPLKDALKARVEALQQSTGFNDPILELHVDATLPWGAIEALAAEADAMNFILILKVIQPDGALRGMRLHHHATPEEASMNIDRCGWLTLGPQGVRFRQGPQTLYEQPMASHDALALAAAVQTFMAGDTSFIAVQIDPGLPWGQAATLLSALTVKDSPPVGRHASLDQALARMERTNGDRPFLYFISSQYQLPAASAP